MTKDEIRIYIEKNINEKPLIELICDILEFAEKERKEKEEATERNKKLKTMGSLVDYAEKID